jgi:hypothetical protein
VLPANRGRSPVAKGRIEPLLANAAAEICQDGRVPTIRCYLKDYLSAYWQIIATVFKEEIPSVGSEMFRKHLFKYSYVFKKD